MNSDYRSSIILTVLGKTLSCPNASVNGACRILAEGCMSKLWDPEERQEAEGCDIPSRANDDLEVMPFCVTEPSLTFDTVVQALLAVIRQPTVAKTVRGCLKEVTYHNSVIGERERTHLAI